MPKNQHGDDGGKKPRVNSPNDPPRPPIGHRLRGGTNKRRRSLGGEKERPGYSAKMVVGPTIEGLEKSGGSGMPRSVDKGKKKRRGRTTQPNSKRVGCQLKP